MKPNGGPAFPGFGQIFTTDAQGRTGPQALWGMEGSAGMTLRDYFAAHAPAMPEQWFKDSPRKKADPLWHWSEASAAWAYCYADAMLAEREKA